MKPDPLHFRCTKNSLGSQAVWQVQYLPDGLQVYDVYLEPVGEHRSSASARAFHAMRDIFAEASGMDKEHVKQLLKVRHGVAYDDDEFMNAAGVLVVPDKRPGEWIYIADCIYYVISTKAMTSDEMQCLNRGVEIELAERGWT